MGSRTTGAVGDRAEQYALAWLTNKGLKPVTRNFRSRGGEIDLILLDGNCLAFVEVRYRKSAQFAAPALTVDHRKQRKILRTAALFLARHRQFANHTMRFDVVAISGEQSRRVDWIRDAFRPADSCL